MENMPESPRSEEIESAIEEVEPQQELEIDSEIEEANARWEQFEEAGLHEKIELFTETLTAGKLDSQEAFEMLSSIREEMNTKRNPKSRVRYAKLVEQLRHTAPELYQKDALYYHSSLIKDAITDMRWENIPELLEPFAVEPDHDIDIFFNVIDALMYHGQIQPLINVMGQAWQKVMDSDNIMPRGINEFAEKFMSLIFFNYVETAANPSLGDPVLRDTIAPYGELNKKWIEMTIHHLSSSTPISWQKEDFGESVDAETWENNLDCLLFDFMADQRKRNGVPFSRSEFARKFLSSFLHEQMVMPASSRRRQQRSSRGGRSGKRGSRRQPSTLSQSPLIPNRELLDQALVELFHFLGMQLYKAGAVVELLPGYLHFLARLNLIHPREMDAALEALLSPIASSTIDILERSAGEPHLVEAVRNAWSDETLDSLRKDPTLASARAKSLIEQPAKPIKPTRKPGTLQTYTFKVTYEDDEDIWRKIEVSENQTLDDLHRIILDSFDFGHDHLYSFYLSGRAWDKSTEYSSPHANGRNADRMRIRDLHLRMKQKFLYLYDFGDQHHFEVQLMEINLDAPKDVRYPVIVEKYGDSPSQYGDWDDEDDEGWEDWEDE